MKESIKQFLTTPAGSWVKVFVTLLITQIGIELARESDFFSWDLTMLKKIIVDAVGAFFPMVINSLNTAYPLYGKQPKETIVIDNPER